LAGSVIEASLGHGRRQFLDHPETEDFVRGPPDEGCEAGRIAVFYEPRGDLTTNLFGSSLPLQQRLRR
jgi:hypothetical protein